MAPPATLNGMTREPAGSSLPRITLRSPADLIAAIPYLLGFHPARSVVLVAFTGGRAVFAARGDLPGPDPRNPAALADGVLAAAAAQRPAAIALIGYGPATAVDPLLTACQQAARQHRIPVQDVLRVDGGRWWSYLCEDPGCCPPGGTPIDVSSHEIAAACAFAGLPALPTREDLAAQVAPVDGPAREAMTAATAQAGQRLTRLVTGLPPRGRRAVLTAEGRTAVTAAITRYGDGSTLDDHELAWLSLLLVSTPVRDLAWQAIATTEPHLRLWTDATRRVEPSLVAAPASLLAFTAWRAGNGALARLALDRALRQAPDYSMALLLADGLRQGLPPSLLDGWGRPPRQPQGGDPGASPARGPAGQDTRPGCA